MNPSLGLLFFLDLFVFTPWLHFYLPVICIPCWLHFSFACWFYSIQWSSRALKFSFLLVWILT